MKGTVLHSVWAGLDFSEDGATSHSLSCVTFSGEVASGSLRIGAVSAPIYNAHEKMKVPDVLFYDNIQVRSLLCTHGQIATYTVALPSGSSETVRLFL